MKNKKHFIALLKAITEFLVIATLIMNQQKMSSNGKLPENYEQLRDGQKKETFRNHQKHRQQRNTSHKAKN
jgi:hypothetical protein